MKKKCIIAAFLFIIVYCMTACGFCYSVDSVVAREQEVVIIKDELVVPLASKTKEEAVPLVKRENTKETYIIMPSDNISKEVADGKVDATDFEIVVDGIHVKMGEGINGYMNKLGFPDTYEETVTEKRDGSNKKYTYEGIVISTNPENRSDVIRNVEYFGEEKTLSGIGIGSTRADIEAAYGIEYVMDPNYMRYKYDKHASIRFQMEGEKCIHIELRMESQ